MTDQCIIYPQENGIVAILVPAPNCKIINCSDVPADRTFRNAWEYVE